MKSNSYVTRALRARDPRFATILGKLGYERADMAAAAVADPLDQDGDGCKGGSPRVETSEALASLRVEYQSVIGKRPFHGWDEQTLSEKIAEAKG